MEIVNPLAKSLNSIAFMHYRYTAKWLGDNHFFEFKGIVQELSL